MKFFNPFTFFSKKSAPQDMEQKSDGITNLDKDLVFLSPYSAGGHSLSLLRFYQSWRYYTKISPLFDAVDRKQRAVKTIKPCLYDTESKEYINEYDSSIPATQILQFLKKPNRDITWLEFIESVTPSYDVTGNVFILVTSMNEYNEPLEYYYINPLDMNYNMGSDGRVYSWVLRSRQFHENFYYKEEPTKGVASYFTKDGTKELWQIKTFNPYESGGDPFGMSPLNPIFHEIEQYEHSQINNKSILKEGVRPSGVLVIDKEFDLTDDQYHRMKAQVRAKAGSENAGDVLILEGGKDFKQLSMSNKDMEFVELIKFVKEQVYVTQGIPLPMISGASMTMNNFEESKYMMYDLSVKPFCDKLFQDLNNLLMRRFDDSGRYELCYNPDTIEATQIKKTESNERKIGSGVITINEGRDLYGYEPLEDEIGESLIGSSTTVVDPEEDDEPKPKDDKEKYDYHSPSGRYRLQLESLTDDEGERKYTDEMIDKKVSFLYPEG